MVVDGELILRNELAHRVLLPNRVIALDKVEDTRLKDEKPAVDEMTIRSGLFSEAFDARLVGGNVERSEAAGLSDSRNSGQRGLLAMKLNECRNVDVANAVAVGQAERFVADVLANALDASACHGVQPRIDEGDTPWLGGRMMDFDGVVVQVDRKI